MSPFLVPTPAIRPALPNMRRTCQAMQQSIRVTFSMAGFFVVRLRSTCRPGSRDALSKYYARTEKLLGRVAEKIN